MSLRELEECVTLITTTDVTCKLTGGKHGLYVKMYGKCINRLDCKFVVLLHYDTNMGQISHPLD